MADPVSELPAAVALHKAGRLDEAERVYRAVLAREPGNADALHLMGLLVTQRGDPASGVELIRRAIAIRPDAAAFHNNLGKALSDSVQQDAALASHRRAVELDDRYAEGHYNLGTALAAAGDLTAAEAAYRRALELAPGDWRARNNLGVTLQRLGRLADAEACFLAVLQGRPDDTEARVNLAGLLRSRGETDAAKEQYRQALALRPDFAKAHAGLGALCLGAGDIDGAAPALRRAVDLAPADEFALMNHAYLSMLLDEFPAAWAAYRRLMAAPSPDLLAQRNRLLAALYDPAVDEPARQAVHREFGHAMAARAERSHPAPANTRDPERRLRVGWLSSDFRDHPVARNLQPLFAHRDPGRFEAICYAEGAAGDTTSAWFRAPAAAWRPTTGLSDAAVAAQIRADQVDVMIYLAGRFDQNRPQVAEWRPAPVQVSLHDPATSGLSAMDYLLADACLVPAGSAEKFTERVLRLPHFYVPPPIEAAPPGAPGPHLATRRVTFGCFNNPIKVNRTVLELWAEILARVPQSDLLLKFRNYYDSRDLQRRVLAVMERRGIAASRLILRG